MSNLDQYASERWNNRHHRMNASHPELFSELHERTEFLNDVYNLEYESPKGNRQRLWHVRNNDYSIQTCLNCGSVCKWDSTKNTYRSFCSVKCGNTYVADVDAEMSESDKVSLLTMDSQQLRVLPKKHPKMYARLRHMTDFLPKDASVMQRLWHIENEAEEIPTCAKCNNVVSWDGALSNNQYREFCSSKCSATSKEVRTRFANTCIDRTGFPHFKTADISHAIDRLSDAEWCADAHLVKQYPLSKIAEMLGVDNSTVTNYFKKHGLRVVRYSRSTIEREIEEWLRDTYDLEFVTNTRDILPNNLELDFFFPQARYAVEVCGMYWHSDRHKSRQYHKNKVDECDRLGIRLLTIYDYEWHAREKQVKSMITNGVGMTSERYNARDCHVDVLDATIQREFFNDTHIQGYVRNSITYGLFLNKRVVAAMAFTIRKSGITELVRFSSLSGAIIRGGFSKLLKHFVRNHNDDFTTITSFADRRHSAGNLYEINGFIHTATTAPTYGYGWYSGNTPFFEHRSKFRKEFLGKRLANYDESKTEFENCDNNNLLRVWDCGKMRYEYKNTEID